MGLFHKHSWEQVTKPEIVVIKEDFKQDCYDLFSVAKCKKCGEVKLKRCAFSSITTYSNMDYPEPQDLLDCYYEAIGGEG